MSRVGQGHIYTVYIRYFWQGNHQIYGHIRCVYIRFWPSLSMSEHVKRACPSQASACCLCVCVCVCVCVYAWVGGCIESLTQNCTIGCTWLSNAWGWPKPQNGTLGQGLAALSLTYVGEYSVLSPAELSFFSFLLI